MGLAFQGLPDPAVQCNVAVIYWWAMCRWDRVLELGIIDGTLDRAAAGSERRRQWGSCKGPAEVLVATLERIGWTIQTPCIWRNAAGQTLRLDEVCPRDIKQVGIARCSEEDLGASSCWTCCIPAPPRAAND